MAPVTATRTGVSRQDTADQNLFRLIQKISSHNVDSNDASTSDSYRDKRSKCADINIFELAKDLSQYSTWRFEDLANLYEWITPLDIIDASLCEAIAKFPGLILVGNENSKYANTHAEVESVPEGLVSSICSILRFLACFLRNATNSKHVFNSVDHLVELLGAADDHIAELALDVLVNLATPPTLHHQPSPELNHHPTKLHSSGATVHSKIMCLARGWGSRGSGLGLYTCVVADDSGDGQGSLPSHAGELTMEYYDTSSQMKTIHLTIDQMFSSSESKSPEKKNMRSTADIFFDCLEQACGRQSIPSEKLFSLLAQIRLSRAFHSNSTRVVAVTNRLKALICALYTHPSQDILAGYFHAQPELCVEIIDILRPTVSSSSVSSIPLSSQKNVVEKNSSLGAMMAIGGSSSVHYSVKIVAIEALTALVGRRDSGNGGSLANLTRQVNVLQELGVGKGQYLGFLPTLIRYSLASLNTYLTSGKTHKNTPTNSNEAGTDLGLDLGLAFIEATKPPLMASHEQVERGLLFIESVLTLTFAVVSVPSGTASLTDCGLIPALISTVALHAQSSVRKSHKVQEESCSLLKFITAQAIQIIETAIGSHASALTAFHELKGTDLLVNRLHEEIQAIVLKSPLSENNMKESQSSRSLSSADRVLLFSIMNCLTGALHQQETTASSSSGGRHLRQPELTTSLKDILENVSSYGGTLAALTSTLLSDVMNSDPQVVHHVHSSGLAQAFLSMLMSNGMADGQLTPGARGKNDEDREKTCLPLTSELVMALPNVLTALSLTEEGSKVVREINPFPALLSLFYNPQYVMPFSACLLNEMTAIVGSGLDELMRHVPSLKKDGIDALVTTVRRISLLGKKLLNDEKQVSDKNNRSRRFSSLEDARTCLIQYGYNISQLLEQVLHNEDHTGPFIEAGGIEALIELYPLLMPSNFHFLSHVSCLSNPATAFITHGTTTTAISSTIKSIASHYDAQKLIRKLVLSLDKQLTILASKNNELNAVASNFCFGTENDYISEGLLDIIPDVPLHELPDSLDNKSLTEAIASYLREVVTTEWISNVLSAIIRAACQRSNEMGGSWMSNRDQWKKELCTEPCLRVLRSISQLHRKTMLEVCRGRSQDSFEHQELIRRTPSNDERKVTHPIRYRLRIVCLEGAIVRDGIEIDSCNNVGDLQMGEVIEAFDRCINSSGVMRYHTSRGWVSEQTRGHGREPIAEVISLSVNDQPIADVNKVMTEGKSYERVECGIPSLRAVCASILGRVQNCQKSILSSLSRVVVQGGRGLSSRPLSSHNGIFGPFAGVVLENLTSHIQGTFNVDTLDGRFVSKDPSLPKPGKANDSFAISDAGIALYMSNALDLLQACLYEEKRDRRVLNIPLLMTVLADYDAVDEQSVNDTALPEKGIFGAIRFILKHSLNDMVLHSSLEPADADKSNSHERENNYLMLSRKNGRRLSRSVAASLPPTLSFLSRLASRPMIVDSHLGSVLGRMKYPDLASFVGEKSLRVFKDSTGEGSFHTGKLARELHCIMADICIELWADPRLASVPAHIIHPITNLVGDIMTCLEEGVKPLVTDNIAGRSSSGWGSRNIGENPNPDDMQNRVRVLRNLSASMSVLFGGTGIGSRSNVNASLEDSIGAGLGHSAPSHDTQLQNNTFEPSEAIIEHLSEMGFSREHALEALERTQSNRVEVAMEYALSHPPPSPNTIERRRAAREERRRLRERREQNATLAAANEQPAPSANEDVSSRPGDNASNDNDTSMADAESSEQPQDNDQNAADTQLSSSEHMNLEGEEENNNPPHENISNEIPSIPPAEKILTEAEKKAKAEKEHEFKAIVCVKKRLNKIRDQINPTLLNLIERGSSSLSNCALPLSIKSNCFSNEKADAMTTVVCFFMLDLCGRYPADRSKIICELIDKLKSHVVVDSTTVSIIPGHEDNFAALCHACLIMLRALPHTRGILLARGMLSLLIGCLRNALSSKSTRILEGTNKASRWPTWLGPVLLLLDIMAQPTAAPIECDENGHADDKVNCKTGQSSSRKSEFARACAERKKYSVFVSKAANDIFACMNGKPVTQAGKKKRTREKVSKNPEGSKTERKTSAESKPAEEKNESTEEGKLPSTENSDKESFPPIPLYTPLMPQEEAEICMCLCLRLLRRRPKKSEHDGKFECPPPPEVVHATLLLLARVLRSYRIAYRCLRMGGAELLLSLPPESRFKGNTCLVGVILRHMLEDESTLRTSMETEIRSTVTKLHRQHNRDIPSSSSSSGNRPRVNARSFIQAVIPLICRDTVVFLKAAATSVTIERSTTESEGRQLQGNNTRVVLLTTDERAKNMKLLAEVFGNNTPYAMGTNYNASVSSAKFVKSPQGGMSSKTNSGLNSHLKRGRPVPQHVRALSDGKVSKSKSSHQALSKRGVSPKRIRKEKHEKFSNITHGSLSGNFILLNGSAANHIVSLLLTALTKVILKERNCETVEKKEDKDDGKYVNERKEHVVNSSDKTSFLMVFDYLEILADLVLAIPTTAAAIHRYRPPSSVTLGDKKDLQNPMNNMTHALSGCAPPPFTAVSFFLHVLLPQERRNMTKGMNEDSEKSVTALLNEHYVKNKRTSVSKLKESILGAKVAQSTARLLVALCARAGEGRRRVVSDLAAALSGKGQIQSETTIEIQAQETIEKECWALLSWGELCIGLAAPRSSGINQDSDSALSYEVVKIMLGYGMCHALMNGIKRIKLDHPMASNIASSLIRPLEVLTRASVGAEVKKILLNEEKEEAEKKLSVKENGSSSKGGKFGKKSNASGNAARRITMGPSQRAESTFADDAMLEDGFDPETAEAARRSARRNARRRDVRRINYRFARDVVDSMVHAGEYENMEDENDDDTEDPDEDMDSDDEDGVDLMAVDQESDEESEDAGDGVNVEVRLGNADESMEDSHSSGGSSSESSEEGTDNSDSSESDEEMDNVGDEEDDDLEDEDEDADNIDVEGEFGWGDEDDEELFENGGGNEDGDDVGAGSEPELEEGWTRIDSSAFGGLFLGSRNNANGSSNNDSRPQPRRGFVLERPEAMIGSIRDILHGSDIHMEALAEIEDHLGIRLTNNQRTTGVSNIDERPRNSRSNNMNMTASRENAGEELSARNRGMVGALPGVHQASTSDSSQSSAYGTGGRSNEISSMEYVYGSGTVRNEYSFAQSQQSEQSEIYYLDFPSSMNAQLFPGGPAASMHARAQQHLHPLLANIDLPPINSMFATVRSRNSNDVRSTRSADGRANDMNFSNHMGFNIGSTGNIIRLNRGPSGSTFDWTNESSRRANNNNSTEARWTDDGQPLDSTTIDFAHAFERVLGESIAQDSGVVAESNESGSLNISNESTGPDASNERSSTSDPIENTTSRVDNESASTLQGENSNGAPQEEESNSEAQAMSGDNTNSTNANETQASISREQSLGSDNQATSELPQGDEQDPNPSQSSSSNSSRESSISEGEGVASSLAAGLQLYSSESSSASASLGDPGLSDSTVPSNASDRNQSQSSRLNVLEESTENPTAENSVVNESNDNEAVNVSNVEPNEHGLQCPPGMDLEVFNSLPVEMQQEVVQQHRTTLHVAEQLDSSSVLDPEALAALPEDMRREVIAQEQQERNLRDEAPANPSNAEEMDNASFVASLAPDLREEILLTADERFLNSLPPDIIAEAQILRERASSMHRRILDNEPASGASGSSQNVESTNNIRHSNGRLVSGSGSTINSNKKRNRNGKMRVEIDRSDVIYVPPSMKNDLGPLVSSLSMKSLFQLLYLLSPIRPARLLQKLFQNLCMNIDNRRAFLVTLLSLLNDDTNGARVGLRLLDEMKNGEVAPEDVMATFPPQMLIGTTSDIENEYPSISTPRRRHGITAVAAIAANLPTSARGSKLDDLLPPVVARRVIECLLFLSKSSPRICANILTGIDLEKEHSQNPVSYPEKSLSCLEWLLTLLKNSLYSSSSTNLEQILALLESVVTPLALLPKDDMDVEISKKDFEAAASTGKEWISVPRPKVSHPKLKLLCSVLRLETCKDASFLKVNTILRRLCRVEENRSCILRELALVAQGLGVDAITDLKLLSIRLNDAVKTHKEQLQSPETPTNISVMYGSAKPAPSTGNHGIPGSSVTLSTSSSELKLLRVLQTLQSLCGETNDEGYGKKNDHTSSISQEMLSLLKVINLDALWNELTACLRVVSVLEGVANNDTDEKTSENHDGAVDTENDVDMITAEETGGSGKKLQNSAAGLLSRFLPTIEAFFVVNASAISEEAANDSEDSKSNANTSFESKNDSNGKMSVDSEDNALVAGHRLVEFAASNKVLLNALLRANPSLLEKGMRAMVQVHQCRPFLDFDVKRQWFKTQIRRQRQQASRRYGSLRLNIRRKHVFEDTFHQLRHRNADEMKGRLHITFSNEEGVDAGGLSREFFAILAKEMFNPNYALFTSTEDGCTFQPNPVSHINRDHLSYFRCVGRIVGKAVVDGFLIDAHFTRSLYKHMLGIKPTHHDMQAIDPDFYKNLQMILEYNLDDIGLDHLTLSTEDHSFGRSQTIDLVPNGRNISVTESNKAQYVSLVCQHRMTDSIDKQIKAYLEGFYELVKLDLISVFTAKELELLISGMPDIDIHDLRKNTEYQGYKSTDKEIGWFWNIMFSLKRSEKAAFLQFATGSAKVPLEGFSQLQGMRGTQKFAIHKAGGASGALMSAHTCFNALDLPVYKSEEEMRGKLMYAITEGGGAFMFA